MKHSIHVCTQLFLGYIMLFISSYSFGQTYCSPTYNFVDCNTLQRRLYINNVILNNRTFGTGCSQAGYAGVVNQTSNGMNDPVVLSTGGNYSMTVNTTDYDSRTNNTISNQAAYAVWIDYNNNSTFDNDERIKSDNSATFSFTLRNNVAGTYRMRIRTQANDPCSAMDLGETEDYILKIVPPAPNVVDETSTYFCINSSFTLKAFGCEGGTIRWYDRNGFAGNNPATVPLINGYVGDYILFYATCTINGIESSSNPKRIGYRSIPAPQISSDKYSLAVGQTATLTTASCIGSGSTVTWSDGRIGAQIIVSPTKTTRYSATCTVSGRGAFQGCTSDPSTEIIITVDAPSTPTISATKSVVCPNESTVLSAGNCAGTIKWSTGTSGSTSITVAPTQKTDYSASCVINGVESEKATTTITIKPATTIVTQPYQTVICEGSRVAFNVTATGSGNLSYLWSRNGQTLSDSSATTPQLTLSSVTTANNGDYRVKVTGDCGVVESTIVSLQIITKITASASAVPTNCPGDATGTISVSDSGGLTRKQYRIVGQTDYQVSPIFQNIRAGIYTVQIADSAGCKTEIQTEVKQPDRITFTVTAPTNAKCAGGSDGAVDVQASGGNGNFTYSINDGEKQTSGIFQGLKANTNYTLKATDVKGCSETTNAFIGAPNQIIVSPTPTPVLCADGSTGKISVSASGGSGAYQYQLGQNTQQITNIFSGLKAGNYTITVKDDNGCEGKVDVSVSQPAMLNVSAIASLISCVSDTGTSVIASANGGTSPYQYQIGTRAFGTNTLFGGVKEGSYPINVKDANECTASFTVNVKKAEPLLLQTITQAASCCTCPDGSMALTSSGGIGKKYYQLGQSGFQQGDTFKNLTSGQYLVMVGDETGCQTSTTVTITNATATTLALTNVKNVNCAGGRDGSATVQTTGGQAPYSYIWQTKNPTDSLGSGTSVIALPEGEFTVTVIDNNRCSSSISGTLTAQNQVPPKPTISQSGGNLISSAQTGVQWYSGNDLKTGQSIVNATQPTFTPLESNPYFVISTVNGCVSLPSDTFVFVVTALEPILPLTIQIISNPVHNVLRVEIEQPDRSSVHLSLIDLTGKKIVDSQIPPFVGKKQYEWLIQQVNAGIYILRVEAGLRRATERVIVE